MLQILIYAPDDCRKAREIMAERREAKFSCALRNPHYFSESQIEKVKEAIYLPEGAYPAIAEAYRKIGTNVAVYQPYPKEAAVALDLEAEDRQRALVDETNNLHALRKERRQASLKPAEKEIRPAKRSKK